MNSRKTLTCNLSHLPQNIFRVIFQYLSVYDLMKGEKAFLNNRPLLSLYRSSLEGFTLKEKITLEDVRFQSLLSWIIHHKLLIEKLEIKYSRELSIDLLTPFRSTLKSITFALFDLFPSEDPAPVIPPLGHFPSLTSVRFFRAKNFTSETLISFFSHNPQLENVRLGGMGKLSNEMLTHISNSCPNIKILSLELNYWVDDETISLLTQQGLFPNLKSLNLQETGVRNQESLRQFILSRPLLSGLLLPNYIYYSKDFLVFYFKQILFPLILSLDNNDLESHSLAISSLLYCFGMKILDERNDVVNPEIFSVDILSHIYHKDSSFEILQHAINVFFHLSKFSSMIDSILQSQFIPVILNHMSRHGFLPTFILGDLLFRCGVFHDHFPMLVQKYPTNSDTLIEILERAIKNHLTLLTTEELQTMIPIVLNNLSHRHSTEACLSLISKILKNPSSQHLIDPNCLMLSFKSIEVIPDFTDKSVLDCLVIFISVNKNFQQAFIESNLFPQIIKKVLTSNLLEFTNSCLLFQDELLADHLVDSGVFEYLLSMYTRRPLKVQTKALFQLLFELNYNKYSEIVNEMELPDTLRSQLFKIRKEKKRTNKTKKKEISSELIDFESD